ncbi:DUF2892 domain-containing protein [Maribacter sp. ANRC-HE7]|uniref:DUF2892 domain-containing protein n=1 Tax=Maribacter aquimaris TaxID=2737171 RepID=A0ABR7V3T9_9FLAO|nr:DUF2892 domain-containing protein [Maribacter aquimaris]MBD0778610.1 DUF2892 domain-containing protein [Maribacter aquimaris]
MKKNMGSSDRMVRLIIALIFSVLYFTNIISETIGLILLGMAGIFLFTSFISFCPLYGPFGLYTCKKEEE